MTFHQLVKAMSTEEEEARLATREAAEFRFVWRPSSLMVMGSAAAEAVRPARRCAGVIFMVADERQEKLLMYR